MSVSIKGFFRFSAKLLMLGAIGTIAIFVLGNDSLHSALVGMSDTLFWLRMGIILILSCALIRMVIRAKKRREQIALGVVIALLLILTILSELRF